MQDGNTQGNSQADLVQQQGELEDPFHEQADAPGRGQADDELLAPSVHFIHPARHVHGCPGSQLVMRL